MLFNSPVFIFGFFPATLVLFYAAGTWLGPRVAQVWLILASFIFYGYWNPIYVALILASMVANYGLGLLLSNANAQGKQARASLYLALGVMGNLMVLGYFKYANFFASTVNQVFDTGWTFGHVILPLGISFFTFQKIAYIADAREGHRLKHDFLQYSLFVLFFPQLIAGPIVHHTEVIPQFGDPKIYRPNMENLTVGLTIFIIGLFKKVIFADNLATIASPVFAAAGAGHMPHVLPAWEAVLAYTFQIYFDFSGYSDMAIGLARCFGVKLPLNFHSPYQADTIIDFWRRWHMTLSRFLRDYLYIPLGGNRKGKSRRYANLMITMLLGGLWHGAGWTFVVWGGLHGLYLIINHAWRYICPWNRANLWVQWTSRLLTFVAVAVAWVFFRAPNFTGAMAIFRGMISFDRGWGARVGPVEHFLDRLGITISGSNLSIDDGLIIIMFGLITLGVWFLPNTQQIMAKVRPAFDFSGIPERDAMPSTSLSVTATNAFAWDTRTTWAIWIGIMGFLCLASLTRVSEFIYYQF